jgi:hypothetical protein
MTSVIQIALHAEDAVSHAFLSDTHCKLSSSMRPGAGRATAKKMREADPRRRRLRDMLSVNMVDTAVDDEEM